MCCFSFTSSTLAFIILFLALRTLTFWVILGFYVNDSKDAKSLTFRRGSEVCQGTVVEENFWSVSQRAVTISLMCSPALRGQAFKDPA